MLSGHDAQPVLSPARDGVAGLPGDKVPTIVSISDVHGLLGEARSALLTLDDHPEYEPIVQRTGLQKLEWVGGEEYILVFNGDLIDRGPNNKEVIEMVERFIDQAPPGHVRVTFGNHEMGVLMPDYFDWPPWYSMTQTDEKRQEFVRSIQEGHVVGAYDGYNFTYAHAGQPQPYDSSTINEQLVAGAGKIGAGIGTDQYAEIQQGLPAAYPSVFGLDGRTGRGPRAGIAWVDFEHLPGTAQKQIVGHTRHERPIRKGNVICENVLRDASERDSGEAILLETPESVTALGRAADGSVMEHEFSIPD
jgi:hypothetical protein